MKNFKRIVFMFALAVPGTGLAQAEHTQKQRASKGEKPLQEADVSQIEGQYWIAKDSDFKVVQNRLYKKEKRFALSATYGPLINDQFSDAKALNLNGSYFFSERWGVEVSHLSLNPEDNSMTREFIDRFAVVPNHNKLRKYIGASVSWVPIYAKASLLEKRILHYDLSLSAGLGMLTYERQYTDKGDESVTAPALSLDVTQQFFITNHWAIRVVYMIKIFKEEVRDSRSPFEVRSEDRVQTNFLNFGLTYFF